MRLEDLTKGATVKGILPDRVITVIGGKTSEVVSHDELSRGKAKLLLGD